MQTLRSVGFRSIPVQMPMGMLRSVGLRSQLARTPYGTHANQNVRTSGPSSNLSERHLRIHAGMSLFGSFLRFSPPFHTIFLGFFMKNPRSTKV
jgi:hypothetical protein